MWLDTRTARPLLLLKPRQALLRRKQTRCVVHWIRRDKESKPRRRPQNRNNHTEPPCPDTIPAPKVLRDWVDSDGRYFVLQGRSHGQTHEQAWSSLSESQKKDIADQVVGVRKKLCSIILNGHARCCWWKSLLPGLLFSDREPHGPFHSDHEHWGALSRTLYDPPRRAFPPQALENLQKRMSKCEPYVLTDCDLNLGNIIVKDGRLAGILDWKFAAWYPVWYECVSASWGWTEEDTEWKKLLQEWLNVYGGGHEDAKGFWQDLRCLRKYPDLDEKGREVLERLLR